MSPRYSDAIQHEVVPIRQRKPRPDEKLGEYMGLDKKTYAPRKLNIGGGQNPLKGYKSIDLYEGADIQHDLFKFPWPIKTNTVTDIECSHFVEHIPHERPEWKGVDGWWMFWGEVYRICKEGADIHVVHPYLQSARAFWDPTHTRYIPSETWQFYMSAEWRKANGIDHYMPDVNFEIITIGLNGIPDDVNSRNDETKMRMFSRDWNVIADLEVLMKKR